MTFPVWIYWLSFKDWCSKIRWKLAFSFRGFWAQRVQTLCQSTLVLNIKMELLPKLKPHKTFFFFFGNSSKKIKWDDFFRHFFLVNKRENSCSDEQPHTLPILGDTNISLYHTGCFPQSDCNSSYHHSSPHSACQCIETKSASNLHETICMQWWNWFFHSGYFTLEAPMSLQVRHLDSSGHTAAVWGRGYMPTFSVCPFLAIYNI